jgi:hypothetical protein
VSILGSPVTWAFAAAPSWGAVAGAVGLIYVTGISGAGKSAACAELLRRGFDADDTDAHGNAGWVDRSTGEVLGRLPSAERTPGYLERYEWRLDPERVTALARQAEDRLVFLCGSTANEAEVRSLFRSTVYLAIDEETLHRRLETRTSNDFGRSPYERAMVVGWHRVAEDGYRRFGAAIVDATRPLCQVVDEIVSIATQPVEDAADQ